jgi:hypothetical protein
MDDGCCSFFKLNVRTAGAILREDVRSTRLLLFIHRHYMENTFLVLKCSVHVVSLEAFHRQGISCNATKCILHI